MARRRLGYSGASSVASLRVARNMDLDSDVSQLQWPHLNRENFDETSERDEGYNCAAWAADDTDNYWWPMPIKRRYFWPDGVQRDETLPSFVQAYATKGYAPCESADLEAGYEKIAIYADRHAIPQHVARQLATGRWTSKLGDEQDIDHATLDALAGGLYGTPMVFMRRPRAT